MWTRDRIRRELAALRILPGDSVLVHASMPAIGQVEGGADSVVQELLDSVGPEGTIMAPTFSNGQHLRASMNTIDPDLIGSAEWGILAERLARLPESHRSNHPAYSFSAVGADAAFLTADAPFHFPLGANSPLARLFQLNGGVLLLGVGHDANTAIHLAESWADVPYGRRKVVVRNDEGEELQMQGAPGCRNGFPKIEPVLRQARILREGNLGNSPSQYMRIQYAVTMAMEMLKGNPESLLCDEPGCALCSHARTLTRPQRPLDEGVFQASQLPTYPNSQ